MPAYRLAAAYDRQPLHRRLSGLTLALGINIVLLLVLLTLGILPPPQPPKTMRGIVVDLLPQSQSSSAKVQARNTRADTSKPVPKPPPIILPVKPTISPPPKPSTREKPWIEMSQADMAAGDLAKVPAAGSGSEGNSEVVGRGPNGEALYAAEWAREPTNAELDGYLPRHGVEGFGLVACKTIAGNRVDDCVELGQTPGSRLASAVRQAAWQFHVRPPRKGGRPLVGSWVQIRIDYINDSGPNEDDR